MPVDAGALDRLVQQVVAAVHPLRIILFGSSARDEAGPDSDLDILVVMPEGTESRRTAQFLHRQLRHVGRPVDILVATPSVLDRQKDNIGLIYKAILDEGKEVYAAQTPGPRHPRRLAGARQG